MPCVTILVLPLATLCSSALSLLLIIESNSLVMYVLAAETPQGGQLMLHTGQVTFVFNSSNENTSIVSSTAGLTHTNAAYFPYSNVSN